MVPCGAINEIPFATQQHPPYLRVVRGAYLEVNMKKLLLSAILAAAALFGGVAVPTAALAEEVIPAAALAEEVIPAHKGGIILCREGGKVTKKIIVTPDVPMRARNCPVGMLESEVISLSTDFLASGKQWDKVWVGLLCLPGKVCPCGPRVPIGGQARVAGEMPVKIYRLVGETADFRHNAWGKPKMWVHPEYGKGCWRKPS